MITHSPKTPSRFVTFVIRDESPFIHLQEPVRKRTVQIALTDEQLLALQLRCTGVSAGTPIYEEISDCFMDDE